MLLRTDSGAAQNCGRPPARPSGLGWRHFLHRRPSRQREAERGRESGARTAKPPPGLAGRPGREAGPEWGRRARGARAGPGARRRGRGAELGLSVVVKTRGVGEVRGVAEVPGEAGPGRGGGLQREGRLCGSSALGARQSVVATLARRFVSNLGPKVMFFKLCMTFRDASSSFCSVLDLQNFALGHNPAQCLLYLI